jgi:hypothetical protein
MGRSDWTF